MIDYRIEPYVGAIPITFEMNPKAVEEVIGAPEEVVANDLKEREERRGPVIVRYSAVDSKVVEIAFLPDARVFYGPHDLFRGTNVLHHLREEDIPYEFVGFIVFLGLGVTMTGFHDNDESQKAISVFKRGRWDEFRSELVPFEIGLR